MPIRERKELIVNFDLLFIMFFIFKMINKAKNLVLNIGQVLQGCLAVFSLLMFAIPIFTVSAIYNWLSDKLTIISDIIDRQIGEMHENYNQFTIDHKDKLDKYVGQPLTFILIFMIIIVVTPIVIIQELYKWFDRKLTTIADVVNSRLDAIHNRFVARHKVKLEKIDNFMKYTLTGIFVIISLILAIPIYIISEGYQLLIN